MRSEARRSVFREMHGTSRVRTTNDGVRGLDAVWRMRGCLAIAFSDLEDDGEDAGFVAGGDEGFGFADLVLDLDELLGALVDVGGEDEGELLGERLGDGDAGGGVAERADEGGVDFDRACAEEFAYAVGDGGVERAAEERAGGGVGAGLELLLLVDLRLLPGCGRGRGG